MLSMTKLNNLLIQYGFPPKYVKKTPLSYEISPKLHQTFIRWQALTSQDRPVTVLISKDIDNLYMFNICCARLFLINRRTSEIVNLDMIEKGIKPRAFFSVIEDAFSLTISARERMILYIAEKVRNGKPVMINVFDYNDLKPLGNEFLLSMQNKSLIVEV